jgi:hypothetical protein
LTRSGGASVASTRALEAVAAVITRRGIQFLLAGGNGRAQAGARQAALAIATARLLAANSVDACQARLALTGALTWISRLQEATSGSRDLTRRAVAAAGRRAHLAFGSTIPHAAARLTPGILLAHARARALARVAGKSNGRQVVAADARRAAIGTRLGNENARVASALQVTFTQDISAFALNATAARAAAEQPGGAGSRATHPTALRRLPASARGAVAVRGTGDPRRQRAGARRRVARALRVGAQSGEGPSCDAIERAAALAERAAQILGNAVDVVAAGVVRGTGNGLAARVGRGRLLAATRSAARLTRAIAGRVAAHASPIRAAGDAVAFGALGVVRTGYAQRALVGNDARALPVTRTRALLAGRTHGSGRGRALGGRSTDADGLAIDPRAAARELPALTALSLTIGLGTQRITGCRRAGALAAGHVAGDTQIAAGRVAANSIHTVAARALRALLAGSTESAHRDLHAVRASSGRRGRSRATVTRDTAGLPLRRVEPATVRRQDSDLSLVHLTSQT